MEFCTESPKEAKVEETITEKLACSNRASLSSL